MPSMHRKHGSHDRRSRVRLEEFLAVCVGKFTKLFKIKSFRADHRKQ